MIIDADTHISPTPEGGNSIGYEELLRRMDRSGVDKALAWLHPPYRRELAESNAHVHEAAQRHPDRILGFGWVDPMLGVESAIAEAKRCLDDYGFFGVKLNGALSHFFIDDPAVSMPVIETIAESGGRLALHVGADGYEFTHPFRVGKIAARFPELPILMAHMGGVGHPDLTPSAIEIAGEHPNITMIGSGTGELAILKAIETLGASRVCFGSDTPFRLMHVEVARYNALLDGEVSDEEKGLIMSGSIAAALGIAD
jgi:predicted TIM-barrel fold metal-dependent hydrolase